MRESPQIRNRIIRLEYRPAGSFLAHDLNHRRHPAEQREALRGSLTDLGWLHPVVENVRTGKLIDGHARIEEALSWSEDELVPVILVEIDEAEEALALAVLDEISRQATTDNEVFALLVDRVSTNNAALQSLLAQMVEQRSMCAAQIRKQQATPEAVQRAIQLGPGREYVVILCDDDEQWGQLRELLELRQVRRGGYAPGVQRAVVSTDRVIPAARLLQLFRREKHGACTF